LEINLADTVQFEWLIITAAIDVDIFFSRQREDGGEDTVKFEREARNLEQSILDLVIR
jgi:hypothetical protein